VVSNQGGRQRRAAAVFGALPDNPLSIPIAARHPLKTRAGAHRRTENRGQIGKALVEIGAIDC
jgi:hypothetical protein